MRAKFSRRPRLPQNTRIDPVLYVKSYARPSSSHESAVLGAPSCLRYRQDIPATRRKCLTGLGSGYPNLALMQLLLGLFSSSDSSAPERKKSIIGCAPGVVNYNYRWGHRTAGTRNFHPPCHYIRIVEEDGGSGNWIGGGDGPDQIGTLNVGATPRLAGRFRQSALRSPARLGRYAHSSFPHRNASDIQLVRLEWPNHQRNRG
jgi:hypothetical protein